MSANSQKTVVIIAGPTAVGKTAVAIEVAKKLGTSIVSADSRQCYKEMRIGVARPTEAELATVPHYFIASHSIKEEITAAYYENYSLEKVNELFRQHDTVVMTGGTGLYLKAFCEGLDAIPPIPHEIRAEIIDGYEKNGMNWLQDELKTADALFATKGEMQNPQRMMRALEVIRATGRSITSFQQGGRKKRPFRIVKTALELPRAELYERINQRVLQMVNEGLVDEVKNLVPFREYNALQTVGYSELFEYFDGKITLPKAIELIQQHTRNYAKRQLTWFKKDDEIKWFSPSEIKPLLDHIDSAIG